MKRIDSRHTRGLPLPIRTRVYPSSALFDAEVGYIDFGWRGWGEGVRTYRWAVTPHPTLPYGEGARLSKPRYRGYNRQCHEPHHLTSL